MDAGRLEQLTKAMCEQPGDDAPVAVCADYLEQAGDARAEYLRDQLRLRARPGDAEVLSALRKTYPVDALSWIGRLEQAGVLECNLTGLPAAWWGGDVPGREAQGTYTRFEYAKLPPLPVGELDGSLAWLRAHPLPDGTMPAGPVDAGAWHELLDALAQRGHTIPPALRVLMEDAALQKQLPTPTANYFISAKREDDEIDPAALQTVDDTGAVFLPFYSDQQCCARWGLWLIPGEHYAPVLSANIDFDDDGEQMTYCDFELAAPDVERYLYRTWIEGRIWYAEYYDDSRRDLLPFERRYLDAGPLSADG